MSKPPMEGYSLSAMIGAIVGSIGGLFAIGGVRAILAHNLTLVFRFPILGFLCFLICGLAGWFLGGFLGPRCGQRFGSYQAELLGGAAGGLAPVLLIAIWAWYTSSH
ncbi:MAG TPA: hypothetical protein PKN20_00850 [Verrucomicrobiota bacterium]|nr:hypothetical protein [Verrucomicrobiota bacterium]HOH39103.1 hypothetical protein [Verrucomicrobiota bacterium]